ncbi:NAD(P)-dependent oxidoreductase [Novosphingobium sp. CF614]|uniref:NAD(P)-dependent oxidoreductase n=1 Tax=Novosphingobium sp. CF614 TaxID=1884364 RepID=UPI000B815D7D|nr:NAD(P)-dependent oxidoreductase [Novosphingobium sp. CF614]
MTGSRIGFIGLGNQGAPIAHRIVDAGLALTVWARRPEVLEAYVAKGATAATSVADLGAACDHVGICVSADADVIQVCDELVPAMRPGSRVVIHSTVLPETCIALARKCAARGVALIDAPVSGGAARAEKGALTVICGGDEAVFGAVRPVLETFGKDIVLLGPVGAGQRAKIINNALLAANIATAHAALGAGVAMGLDRAALARTIRSSSGYSFGLEVSASTPSPADFKGAALLVKDVGLLEAALSDDPGAAVLSATARPYLTEAMG